MSQPIDPKTIASEIERTQANRSIVPTGYKDAPQQRLITYGTLRERASNTEPVGFLEIGDRSFQQDIKILLNTDQSSLKHWNCWISRLNPAYGEKSHY